MAITTECPHCGKSVRAPDSAAGKRVKCSGCQAAFRVSVPSRDEDETADDSSGRVTAKPKVPTRRSAADEPKRPRKKKRRTSPVLLVAALGGVVLLVGLVGGGIWLALRGRDGGAPTDKQVAKGDPAPPVGAFAVEKGRIVYGGFTPDGKHILSCAVDDNIRLWDSATGNPVKSLVVPMANCAAIAPDGKHAVVGTRDGGVKLLDLDKWQEERAFAGHQQKSPVMAVDFSMDSSRVVSAGLDYSVRVWDTKTGQEVWHKERRDDVGTPRTVSFHPGGSMVYVGYAQGSVCLYNVGQDPELGRYNPVAFAKKIVYAVLTNASGRLLAAGDAPEVVVMDQMGTQRGTFRGHTANTRAIALTSDGGRAVSGGVDKVVRVWDVESCKEVQAFEGHTAEVTSVAFSPDGRRVLSASSDKTLRLWTLAEPVGPRKDDPTASNPAFLPLVKKLVGRWSVEGFKDAKVTWDFRDDATFTITVNRAGPPLTISGTWRVRGIGLDSGQIQWRGEAMPSEFFQSDEKIDLTFQGDVLQINQRGVAMRGTRQR